MREQNIDVPYVMRQALAGGPDNVARLLDQTNVEKHYERVVAALGRGVVFDTTSVETTVQEFRNRVEDPVQRKELDKAYETWTQTGAGKAPTA